MAPTLAAVGCEMLRFETGEAVERSPRNRMLVRQSTVVNFLGERHCCSRGEYSTKGSQYRATPHISLPRRDSFFSQTKSCLSGSVHETFPDTIVTNLPGSLSRWIYASELRLLRVVFNNLSIDDVAPAVWPDLNWERAELCDVLFGLVVKWRGSPVGICGSIERCGLGFGVHVENVIAAPT